MKGRTNSIAARMLARMRRPDGRKADEPRCDPELDALVGAVVIVGLTFLDAADEVVELKQLWGVVEAADATNGVTLRLRGRREGETFVVPPNASAFEPADPGSYRLRSTGETIEDPDYLTTWTIQRSLS